MQGRNSVDGVYSLGDAHCTTVKIDDVGTIEEDASRCTERDASKMTFYQVIDEDALPAFQSFVVVFMAARESIVRFQFSVISVKVGRGDSRSNLQGMKSSFSPHSHGTRLNKTHIPGPHCDSSSCTFERERARL